MPPTSQVLEDLGEAAKDEETTVTTITGAGGDSLDGHRYQRGG